MPIALGSLTPVSLQLTNARVRATAVSETGMTALIGGLLRVSDINNTVLPAIYPQFGVIVDRDCPGKRTPPGCNCTGAGAQIIQFLDNAPRDCVISLNELINNQGVQEALRPDVCSTDSCPPGATDAVSFGFRVQTVKASFPLVVDEPNLPPDPGSVAPALDRSVPTSVVWPGSTRLVPSASPSGTTALY